MIMILAMLFMIMEIINISENNLHPGFPFRIIYLNLKK